jgi:hypothetical protein
MSLVFRYTLHPVNQPIVSLGGRMVRPKPIVALSLTGPAATVPLDGLVDTGADDIVVPETVATMLGIDLSGAPTIQATGANRSPIPVRFAEATRRLSDGQESREWRAWVGFTSSPMRWGLLGFAGFLQFFTAVFDGARETVELTVNPLYPGT